MLYRNIFAAIFLTLLVKFQSSFYINCFKTCLANSWFYWVPFLPEGAGSAVAGWEGSGRKTQDRYVEEELTLREITSGHHAQAVYGQ